MESLYRDVASKVVPGTKVPRPVITTSELEYQTRNDPRIFQGVERIACEGAEDMAGLLEQIHGQAPPAVTLAPDSVALLTYTSGTTGPPKGAMNTHGNIVFNAQTYREWGALTERDTILGIAPLFHVTGLIGHIGVSLLTGAPLVLFYRFDAPTALELIEHYRATFTVGAITAFISLAAHPDFAQRNLSSLTKVLSGGAPIAPAVVEDFRRKTGVCTSTTSTA